MSKMMRRLLSVVLFWAIFFSLFAYAQDVVIPKVNAWDNNILFNHFYTKYTNAQRCRAFEQLPENSVDVAFIGSSIVFCGINPIQIYEQNGIASHDFAVGALSGALTTYMNSVIFETQRPKVIVLDATLLYIDDINESSFFVFPFTKLTSGKIDFALHCGDLTAAAESLFPMLMCHQNWPNVNADDFVYPFSSKQDDLLGMVGIIRSPVDQQSLYQSFSKTAMSYADIAISEEFVLSDKAKQQLVNFQNSCREMGAEPLLIACPSVFGNEITSFLLQVEDFASTQGIPMINFNIHREGLNLIADDFSDSMHLTLTGMSKFTAVLTDYLKTNYDLPDRRGQVGYERYDQSVTLFHEALQQLAEQASDP